MADRRRRVPLVLQATSADCGAACLTMVARAHGIRVRPSEVRALLPTSGGAVTARGLRDAATVLGLDGRAVSVRSAEALCRLPTPFVAWWNGNHFVVVEGVGTEQVRVADPARGRRILGVGEFDEGFRGVALVFSPDRSAARRARPSTHLPVHRPPIGPLVRVVALSVVLQALAILTPLLTRHLVDQARRAPVLPWAIAIAACSTAVFLALWARSRVVVAARMALSRQLVTRLVRHVLALPFPYFLRRNPADVMTGLQAAELLREFVSERVVTVVLDCLVCVGYLVAIALIAPPLGVVCGVAIVLFVVLGFMTSRTAADHAQSALACTAESQALLLEAVTGIESVQAGGGGAHVYSRWSAAYLQAEEAIRHRDRCVALVERVAYVIQYATSGVLLWVALLVLGSGKLSPGDVLALAALGTAAVTPIASVLQAAQQLTIGAAHLDRLRDLFAVEPSRLNSDLPCGRGEVTVANLAFSYDDGAEVLHDIDLCARPGEIVGVVGRSGSGKTTLVRLLVGLLAPTAGAVYLDGVRASEVDPAARPELVAVLPQQPVVLSGSVADNVAFGRPVDRTRVEAALHLAALSDDVRGWRLGLDTPLGEAGIRLSGGQRQRLALARALYTRPRILVLDEPTSSVDALTERAIRDALATLGCTQIVIAHRLATLADADRIYVLDAGRIVDEGTAAELRHRQGIYRRMAVEQGLVTEPAPAVGERDTVTATPSG